MNGRHGWLLGGKARDCGRASCGALWPPDDADGYRCTRTLGHRDQHEAWTTEVKDGPAFVWPQGSEGPTARFRLEVRWEVDVPLAAIQPDGSVDEALLMRLPETSPLVLAEYWRSATPIAGGR